MIEKNKKAFKLLTFFGKFGLITLIFLEILKTFNLIGNSQNLYVFIFLLAILVLKAELESKKNKKASSLLLGILAFGIILVTIPFVWFFISEYFQ